jgi:hypothetical protein
MIISQTSSSEQKISAGIVRHFDTILTSTNQKPGTVKEYTVPQVDVNFYCNTTQELYYYDVSDVKVKDTQYDLIFSPRNINSRKLYTWTLDWKVPYRVATFMYLASKENAFIFWNEPLTNPNSQLVDNFADNITTMFMNGSVWPKPSLNYDSYTYVFIKDEGPADRTNIISEKSNIIVIDPENAQNIFEEGTVYYCDRNNYDGNTEDGTDCAETKYFGMASLYGAIFADKDLYECTMNKAYHRLQILTKLQWYRTNRSIDLVSDSCGRKLDSIVAAQPGAKQLLVDLNNTVVSGFVPVNVGGLVQQIKRIDRKNNQLALEAYCPTIY